MHRTYLDGSLCLVAERKDHLEDPPRWRPPSNHETFDRSKIEKEEIRKSVLGKLTTVSVTLGAFLALQIVGALGN